jgi:hypothetical protein
LTVGILLYSKRNAASATISISDIDITNESQHLQVISSSIDANDLILKLKNTANEPIIAYIIDNPENPKARGIDSDVPD